MSKNLTISIIILFSLVGIISVLFVTKFGIGTSPDSVVYIGAARNMLLGKGLTIPFGQVINSPMTHHAPLYSVLLRIIGIPKIDPLNGARWLNAFIFGCLILFVGFSLFQLTRPSLITPILGSFLTLSAYPMLGIHAYAWTEPLFILLGLLGLYTLSLNIKKPNIISLIVSAILIGLATLTRYAGIAFIGTGIFSIILLPKKKFPKRLLQFVSIWNNQRFAFNFLDY